MEEKLGVKELKELLKFVIEFGESIDLAMADKKFEVSELGLLIAPLMQVGPAFEGFDKLGAEIKDLEESEMIELAAFVREEFDLQNDKIEEVIEVALDLGVRIYGFIKLFAKEEVPVEPAA